MTGALGGVRGEAAARSTMSDLTPEAFYLAAASPPMITLHDVIPHPGHQGKPRHELSTIMIEKQIIKAIPGCGIS